MTTRRRSPGEGGCWSYQTAKGERWRAAGPVLLPDGTAKEARKRGFATKSAGLRWLHEQQAAGHKGEYIEPSKQRLGAYGTEVIASLRIKPQTRASYAKNWRLHVEPYPVAALPLASVAGVKLSSHYRQLEKSGRKDHRKGEALSARTVRYVHTIVHRVLAQAVQDGLLGKNPADAASPPTAREAKAPEMHPWEAGQLAAFLGWARGSQNHALWHVLANTGARRGEVLSLRWRDLDLNAGTIAIRRSAGIVRTAGEGAEMVEDDTKSSKPRVIDIDAATVGILRAWKTQRGSLALPLVKPPALVFGGLEGEYRNGEHVSRQFVRDVSRCGRSLGEDALPMIRLHDLRHTHATILLLAGVPVHVVAQRLGHASPSITLNIYAHVMPGNQREAADLFARLVKEAGA